MATETLNTNETVATIAVAVSELTALLSAVEEKKLNTIPYEGSWTAPQLVTHVSKSINGMAKALKMDGKPAERNPGARIEELKSAFLDLSIKMQSPEFIVPENGIYERQPTIDKLNDAFRHFEENANSADSNTLVEGLPLGPITKLEIIHFTLFHTQRHIQQMKKICEALRNT